MTTEVVLCPQAETWIHANSALCLASHAALVRPWKLYWTGADKGKVVLFLPAYGAVATGAVLKTLQDVSLEASLPVIQGHRLP